MGGKDDVGGGGGTLRPKGFCGDRGGLHRKGNFLVSPVGVCYTSFKVYGMVSVEYPERAAADTGHEDEGKTV